MTISSTTSKSQHEANGVLTTFSYGFKIYDEEHLEVYLDDVLQTSGYTVTDVGEDAGGDVEFDSAPADGTSVTLRRNVPNTQETDYVSGDAFAADTHERALDLAAMRDQQLQEQMDRAVLAPVSDDGSADYSLPSPEAGRAIIWNTTGDGMINGPTASEITSAQAYSENAAASAEQAEQWAQEAEDVEVATGEYSAYHWAKKAEDFAGGSAAASAVSVVTDDFDGNLSSSDDTVQKALDTLDDLTMSGATAADTSADTTSFDGILSATEDSVQEALDVLDDIDATDIPAVTTNFNGLLTSSENTVQKVLDVLDDLSVTNDIVSASAAIALSKLQNISASRILGASSAGAIQQLTAAQVNAITGNLTGIYFNTYNSIGNISITGLSFTPKYAMCLCKGSSPTDMWSLGFRYGTADFCFYTPSGLGGGMIYSSGQIAYLPKSPADWYTCSFGSGTCTLTRASGVDTLRVFVTLIG